MREPLTVPQRHESYEQRRRGSVWFKPANRQREYNSPRSQIFIIALSTESGKAAKVRRRNYQTADGDFKAALAVEMQIISFESTY